MIIAVTGSTGLIGSALVSALEAEGHQVRPMVRREVRDREREIRWSPASRAIEASKLGSVDAVVHLAGKNVACRWNDAVKRDIRESRIKSTQLLAETLSGLPNKPRVLVSASAIGLYGDRNGEVLTEESPPGDGFLSEVCRDWEAATRAAWEAGIRVVQLRIGLVLSSRGGALAKMLPAFKMGGGGIVGTGKQYVSWIVLDDVVRMIQFVLEGDHVHGAINCVAPEPVTNLEFTRTLGRVLHRPTLVPMPAFALRMAFGEMADELLLSSTRVSPERIQECGFEFAYPELESALRHLLQQ
jgi:uncharacterized protein (TIGR01777 family)